MSRNQPPPLPSATLERVSRIAAFDGWGLVVLAGGFGLVSLLAADWLGVAVGSLIVGAGLLELHGRRRLLRSEIGGVNGLVTAQLFLLAVILCYAAYQYFEYDPRPLLARLNAQLAVQFDARGQDRMTLAELFGMRPREFDEFFATAVRAGYLAVGVGSVLVQGGLAFYYHSRRAKLAAALRKS